MAYQLKIIQKGLDSQGRSVALCRGNGACFNEDMSLYSVWLRKGSYSGRAPGGIAYRWVYFELGISLEAAQKLFAKKVKVK